MSPANREDAKRRLNTQTGIRQQRTGEDVAVAYT